MKILLTKQNRKKSQNYLTKNNNMVIHIAKTTKGRNLLSKSVYKLKYAQNNNFKQQQLKLDLVGNTNKVTIEPYYGIITYNVDQNLEIKAII